MQTNQKYFTSTPCSSIALGIIFEVLKYRLKLSYNGTAYHGWQKQDNAISIQSTIEQAFTKINGSVVDIVGCGRTDTGVHARRYCAHFNSDELQDSELVYKLNSILPSDIAIESCQSVDESFHARFSAVSRVYQYFIHTSKNPFLVNQSFCLTKKLDLDAMNQACTLLMTYSDFASFCKKGADNKTTLCEIMGATWHHENDQIIFTIKADRFLRNMVRAIVGAMVDIGLKKITLDDFRLIIEARNNQFHGTAVPAHGLFLWEVNY